MDLGNKLFICSQEVYFGVYFPSCEAMREINTKIVLMWTHKQFVMKVHTLFHFLHDIILYVAIKYNLPTSPLCLACPVYILLMTSQSVADGVIMTRQLWCKNVTNNGSWCMGIKGEMSGTVCVTFTWYMYIYELFIAFVCFVVCSLL